MLASGSRFHLNLLGTSGQVGRRAGWVAFEVGCVIFREWCNKRAGRKISTLDIRVRACKTLSSERTTEGCSNRQRATGKSSISGGFFASTTATFFGYSKLRNARPGRWHSKQKWPIHSRPEPVRYGPLKHRCDTLSETIVPQKGRRTESPAKVPQSLLS